MNMTQQDIEAFVFGRLEAAKADWDYEEPIHGTTLIFRELGLRSLDVVILGVAIQEFVGQQLPFEQLFAELGEAQRDLSVQELVDFVARHVNPESAAA
jgi:acyl carrier protein